MQQRKGRILIVDDLPQWRDEPSEILIDEGFLADTAATIEEARAKLQDNFYHLLILDLRMNASDYDDYAGIEMLQMLRRLSINNALQIIVLSAHATINHVREAFHDHQVADFIPKNTFKPETFLTSVQDVFSNQMRINLKLDIHWDPPETEALVLQHVELNKERLHPHTPLFQRINMELDDLLCRLFYQATTILVKPLVPGYSGTGVMRVQPFYTDGGGRVVVTKFGASHKIEEERRNFDAFVLPFVGGGRNTTVQEIRYTPLLGGVVYSLLGTASAMLEDFGSFYQHAPQDKIKEVLDNLFSNTCRSWYANLGHQRLCDLSDEYRRTFGPISHPIEETLENFIIRRGNRFILPSLNNDERDFTDPLPALNRTFMLPTYLCTTHGDLNQHNVLIDDRRYTWLIDFQGTGKGHYLRDFAMLDSVVRFQLLSSQHASLAERLHMEELLCSITRFSDLRRIRDTFTTSNKALEKAFLIVISIRLKAHNIMGSQNNDDMSEYFIALLHNALRTLSFASLKQREREHALLSASLLLDAINAQT